MNEMMQPDLYSEVVVNRDIPEADVKRGDLALFVERLHHPAGGEDGAVLEIFNALGDSLRIVTVPLAAIERLQEDQVPAVRPLVAMG